MPGLSSAAQQIQSYGRGRDTLLAHISPDEAKFIDQIQGGRRTNPMTGLPEYSLFGKILKAVVRVGAGIGGFMIGGPAGAAAGSAAATKLTGGSWKDALKAGAFSGVGGELGQGLTGGGWNVLGGGAGAAGAAAPSTMSVGSGAGLGGIPATIGSVAAPAAAATSGGLGGLMSQIPGGYGGLGAALGGLSTPLEGQPGDTGPVGPPPGYGGTVNLNVAPMARTYQPYTGDPAKFGETPGGYQFFDNVNPKPVYLAEGGSVGLGAPPDDGQAGFDYPDPGNPGWPYWRRDQAMYANAVAEAEAAQKVPPAKRTQYHWDALRRGLSFLGDLNDNEYKAEAAMLAKHPPQQRAAGGRVYQKYAQGGGVMGPRPPGAGLGGLGMLRNPGVPSQIQSPQIGAQPQQMNLSPQAQRASLRQAAMMGYNAVNARSGGAISGPGTETSDSVPAMLSDGEHVIDAATVRAAGHGSVNRGHKAVERFKRQARAEAGMKNPSKPPAFGGA